MVLIAHINKQKSTAKNQFAHKTPATDHVPKQVNGRKYFPVKKLEQKCH